MKTVLKLFLTAALGLHVVQTMATNANTVFFPATQWYQREDQQATLVTVQRSGGTDAPASVDYATADVNAWAGVDYLATSGTLHFAPGIVEQTFVVTILDNGRADGSRTVGLRLSNPQGAEFSTDNLRQPFTIPLLIEDNERPVILDPTFRASVNGYAKAVAVQPDGHVVFAGPFTQVDGIDRCGLARLNPDGSLDPSFEPGCIPGDITSVAIQLDGKILLSDRGDNGPGWTRRLLPDGRTDGSFQPPPELDGGQLFVQADGRIVVWNGDIWRLKEDGTLDLRVRLWGEGVESWYPGAFALQPDGKFLAGLNRFHADGSPDTSFQPVIEREGEAVANNEAVQFILVQPNGQIVIGGRFDKVNGLPRRMLARLNADGSVDSGFDPGLLRGFSAVSGALLPNGKLLASFYLGFPSTGLLRFNADGSQDSTASDLINGDIPMTYVLAQQPDGKVIGRALRRYFVEPLPVNTFEFGEGGRPAVLSTPGQRIEVVVHRLGDTTAGPVTVDFTTRDGMARAGVDYVATRGTLTFAPIENWKLIEIPVLENPSLKREATFSIVLQNPKGGILGLPAETPAVVAPVQTLTIQPVSQGLGGKARLRLASTTPGITYSVLGWDSINALHTSSTFYQARIATGDSLEFEDTDAPNHPRRFYRAVRRGVEPVLP